MPERIGRFHVQAILGRGAMGVVYRGHDEEIDRLVAIKLIRADLLDTEERENYLRRFRNEAKIAGRCVHANIVSLYDFAMHDGNPYLVMEHVNGVGLQQFFPRGARLPVAQVLLIALQVLDALHYAHERGIVHRDIKPANILLTQQSTLKITDFGISRLTSMELTAVPLLIGTPGYMSPEQCIGAELDGRSDLFSLGCVLYELLAGERPFTGVSYTDTIFNIINTRQKPLSAHRDDLPDGLSDVIDRALSKNAEERHEDASAFARILRAIDGGSGNALPTAADAIPIAKQAPVRAARTVGVPTPVVVSANPDTTLLQPRRPPGPAMPDPVQAPAGSTEAADAAILDAAAVLGAEVEIPPPPTLEPDAADATTDAAAEDGERKHVTACLAEVMGPIAPILVLRVERPDLTREALIRDCAAYVVHEDERARFLALVSHPDRDDRVQPYSAS